VGEADGLGDPPPYEKGHDSGQVATSPCRHEFRARCSIGEGGAAEWRIGRRRRPLASERGALVTRRSLVARAAVVVVSLGVLGGAVASRASTPDGASAVEAAPAPTTSYTVAARPSTSPTVAQSTSSTVARATTSTTSTTTSVPERPGKAFCESARAATEAVRRISVSLTDAARLPGLLEQGNGSLAEAEPLSPAGSKADVAALRSTVRALHDALEQAGYDLSKLPPSLLSTIGSPEVLDAIRRLDANAAKAC
jgi:hypothetical protein